VFGVGRGLEDQSRGGPRVGVVGSDEGCIGLPGVMQRLRSHLSPVLIEHELRAREFREITMCWRSRANITLEEYDFVSRAWASAVTSPRHKVA